jgi:TRAP-type C4-dicarboxylate transport system substrate-binding protein
MKALTPSARDALLKAAATAEARGWAASESAAQASVDELRHNGMKIERVPREVSVALKRFGERLSLEWVRQVGAEANDVFIPYFTQS